MQTTSQTWKDLWAAGNAWLETKAVINGTDYTEISNPVINRALMQNGCSIGNAVSATCQFSVRTSASIPKSATVVIKMRLTDGTTTSEWLSAGTFYISHRQRDPVTGVLTLECYDAMLKANAQMPDLMPWTTAGGEPITTASGEIIMLSAHYPRAMSAVMDDLAILLGDTIRIDPETTVETGDNYVITAQDVGLGTTINQVLCKIAAANGGNWIITPDNMLKLVPLTSAADAASATVNVVDVDGITGGIDTSNTGTITGIRYSVDNVEHVVGDETGIVIDADVSAAVAADLATKLIGMTYQAYSLQAAIFDPAAEVGDYVRGGANGEVSAVLCAEMATLGFAFRADISAPEIGELADEYPYENFNGKTVQYVDAAVQQLNNSLTQQEIFDRLTDGGLEQGLALETAFRKGPSAAGEKKLYLNLDYARFGKLVADFIEGGTLTLGGLNNANGQIALKDSTGTQIGTWDNLKLLLGTLTDFVQLYGDAAYNGVTEKTPLYVKQTYSTKTIEMMLKQAMLILLRGTLGLQISPDSISLTEDSGDGYEAYLDIARGYIEALDGDLSIISDSGYVDLVGVGLKINGTAGASGTFTANGHTLTITDGIITGIT